MSEATHAISRVSGYGTMAMPTLARISFLALSSLTATSQCRTKPLAWANASLHSYLKHKPSHITVITTINAETGISPRLLKKKE